MGIGEKSMGVGKQKRGTLSKKELILSIFNLKQ